MFFYAYVPSGARGCGRLPNEHGTHSNSATVSRAEISSLRYEATARLTVAEFECVRWEAAHTHSAYGVENHCKSELLR